MTEASDLFGFVQIAGHRLHPAYCPHVPVKSDRILPGNGRLGRGTML